MGVVQLHDGAGFGSRQAGAHVADAINRGQAVVAAAARGLDVGAQEGDEQGITGFVGIRPFIYNQSHKFLPYCGFVVGILSRQALFMAVAISLICSLM